MPAAYCLDEDIVVGQAGGCVVVSLTTMAKLGIMVTGVDPQQSHTRPPARFVLIKPIHSSLAQFVTSYAAQWLLHRRAKMIFHCEDCHGDFLH